MLKIWRSRSHYDVIGTSYADEFYLFLYELIGETHSFTLVAKGYIKTFSIDNSEGVHKTPHPFGGSLRNAPGGRQLMTFDPGKTLRLCSVVFPTKLSNHVVFHLWISSASKTC